MRAALRESPRLFPNARVDLDPPRPGLSPTLRNQREAGNVSVPVAHKDHPLERHVDVSTLDPAVDFERVPRRARGQKTLVNLEEITGLVGKAHNVAGAEEPPGLGS